MYQKIIYNKALKKATTTLSYKKWFFFNIYRELSEPGNKLKKTRILFPKELWSKSDNFWSGSHI